MSVRDDYPRRQPGSPAADQQREEMLAEIERLREQVAAFANEIVQMHQDRDVYDTALEAQLDEARDGLDERDRIIIERDNEIAQLRARTAEDRTIVQAAISFIDDSCREGASFAEYQRGFRAVDSAVRARRVAAGGTVPADPPADPHRGMSFNTNPCNHSWPCEGSAIDHFCMWGRGHRLDFHKCQCSAVLPVAAPADPPEAQP